jgi:hypothetical protein
MRSARSHPSAEAAASGYSAANEGGLSSSGNAFSVTGMRFVGRATAVAAAAGTVSFTFQKIAEVRDCRRFPPPGRLVDISGRHLHMMTTGEGSPAVIVISAIASSGG